MDGSFLENIASSFLYDLLKVMFPFMKKILKKNKDTDENSGIDEFVFTSVAIHIVSTVVFILVFYDTVPNDTETWFEKAQYYGQALLKYAGVFASVTAVVYFGAWIQRTNLYLSSKFVVSAARSYFLENGEDRLVKTKVIFMFQHWLVRKAYIAIGLIKVSHHNRYETGSSWKMLDGMCIAAINADGTSDMEEAKGFISQIYAVTIRAIVSLMLGLIVVSVFAIVKFQWQIWIPVCLLSLIGIVLAYLGAKVVSATYILTTREGAEKTSVFVRNLEKGIELVNRIDKPFKGID